MQSRPRLANVIGVVVIPAPPPLPQHDGTDSDNEFGLPTAPAPPRPARIERSSTGARSTFIDTGAAAAAATAKGLEDVDWTDGDAAAVVVSWVMWLRAGPAPTT